MIHLPPPDCDVCSTTRFLATILITILGAIGLIYASCMVVLW